MEKLVILIWLLLIFMVSKVLDDQLFNATGGKSTWQNMWWILILIDVIPYSSGTWERIEVIPSLSGVLILRFTSDEGRTYEGTHQPFHNSFLVLLLMFSTSRTLVPLRRILTSSGSKKPSLLHTSIWGLLHIIRLLRMIVRGIISTYGASVVWTLSERAMMW